MPYLLSLHLAGFQSTASLTAADQHDGEKEFKLHVLDPADDCSSMVSSNRSSIRSDTSLMVKDRQVLCVVWCHVDKPWFWEYSHKKNIINLGTKGSYHSRLLKFFCVLCVVMQSEGVVLSKSVRQRSLKKVDNLAATASVGVSDGQTSLDSAGASKNALSGIVSDCAW